MAKKQEEEPMTDEEGSSMLKKIGPWAFILGLVVAVGAAVSGSVFWLLGILGVIVGLLNITEKEVTSYLLASLTFLLSANTLSVTLTKLVSAVPVLANWMKFVDPLMANITLFVAPGAAVVALKALYAISREA